MYDEFGRRLEVVTELVGYDEYGRPIYETRTRIAEAS